MAGNFLEIYRLVIRPLRVLLVCAADGVHVVCVCACFPVGLKVKPIRVLLGFAECGPREINRNGHVCRVTLCREVCFNLNTRSLKGEEYLSRRVQRSRRLFQTLRYPQHINTDGDDAADDDDDDGSDDANDNDDDHDDDADVITLVFPSCFFLT